MIALSVVLGLLSAFCWIAAAIVAVPAKRAEKKRTEKAEQDGSGWISASVTIKGNDLAETMELQSRWNAVAALFAAASMITQAIPLLLKTI